MGDNSLFMMRYNTHQLKLILHGTLGDRRTSFLFEDRGIDVALEQFFNKSGDVRKLLQLTEIALGISRTQAQKEGWHMMPVNYEHWKPAIAEMWPTNTTKVL